MAKSITMKSPSVFTRYNGLKCPAGSTVEVLGNDVEAHLSTGWSYADDKGEAQLAAHKDAKAKRRTDAKAKTQKPKAAPKTASEKGAKR